MGAYSGKKTQKRDLNLLWEGSTRAFGNTADFNHDVVLWAAEKQRHTG